MPFIKCNNIKLHYKVSGRGPAVILLHGNSSNLHFFDRLSGILQEEYTVYRIDSRCHGMSERTDQISYQLMMQDTAAFIQRLSISHPVIVGASDGGIVGLLLSIAYPKLPSCNVFCGVNTRVDGLRWWAYTLFRMLYMRSHSPVHKMMTEQPDITRKQLGCIEAPTMIMAGSRDLMTGEHTLAIADSLPKGRICILKGETHRSYVRKPQIFMRYAGSFIEKYHYHH